MHHQNKFVFPGISYSVSTQEFLVERCLEDDQQLLDALTPGPLLDADLLALDENTLKSQLIDSVDPLSMASLPHIIGHPADSFVDCSVKLEKCEQEIGAEEILKRSRRHNECLESDENLCKFCSWC